MRLRQPANRMTDLEANQGGRNHQSVLHVPTEEPDILYWCPACRSQHNTTTFDGSHVWVVTVFGRHGRNWLDWVPCDRGRLDNRNFPNAAICDCCATA